MVTTINHELTIDGCSKTFPRIDLMSELRVIIMKVKE